MQQGEDKKPCHLYFFNHKRPRSSARLFVRGFFATHTPTTLIAKFVAAKFAVNVSSLAGWNPLPVSLAHKLGSFEIKEIRIARLTGFPYCVWGLLRIKS
jgi:hypothetical protein